MTHPVRIAIALDLAVACATPMVAQTPKYSVTVTTDRKADFSKFKTYTWENGWQAYDKTVHANIRAAVDRQLAAVGLEKRESGPVDLLVTYASLRRVDVDLKAKPAKDGARPQYDVGTLVVLLLDPGTRNELFRGRVDKPIVLEPEKVQPVVDSAVTEMFAKYPTRVGK
jgi:hypothetical protein